MLVPCHDHKQWGFVAPRLPSTTGHLESHDGYSLLQQQIYEECDPHRYWNNLFPLQQEGHQKPVVEDGQTSVSVINF
nr:hypothetical protein [Moorena sp. SIO4G3]